MEQDLVTITHDQTKKIYWEFPLLDELNIPEEAILLKMDSKLYLVSALDESPSFKLVI